MLLIHLGNLSLLYFLLYLLHRITCNCFETFFLIPCPLVSELMAMRRSTGCWTTDCSSGVRQKNILYGRVHWHSLSPGAVIDSNIVWRLRFNWTCYVAVELDLTVITDDKCEGSGRRKSCHIGKYYIIIHSRGLRKYKGLKIAVFCLQCSEFLARRQIPYTSHTASHLRTGNIHTHNCEKLKSYK